MRRVIGGLVVLVGSVGMSGSIARGQAKTTVIASKPLAFDVVSVKVNKVNPAT